jgi:hypothetical protein
MVCISRFGFLFFSFRSQDDFLAEIAVSQNTGLPQASKNTYQQLPNPATKSRSWLSILMRNDAQLNMFSYMLFVIDGFLCRRSKVGLTLSWKT